MKVKDIKVGEIFAIDYSGVRPKLKLKEGYLDLASQYVWVCNQEIDAEILTDSQLTKIARNWRMTMEEFEKYKQKMIRKYIEEVDK